MPMFKKLIDLGIEPVRGEKFEPFTDEEVAEIERKSGGSLPQQYRQFLVRYGHSTFAEEVNCASNTEPLWFGWLFSFREMVASIEVNQEVLPDTIIPIGSDYSDNLFCLGVKGKDTDHVYFHNHSSGWHGDAQMYEERGEPLPPDIRYVTIHKIANSFEEFIKNMKKQEETS